SSTKARQGLSRWALVGRECDTKAELERLTSDADTAFATVGPAATHDGSGTEIIGHATRLVSPTDPTAKPWFAAGGVTLHNLDEIIEAGATRVAVGAAITSATDIERATRAFTTVLQERWGKPDMANYLNGPLLP
ncbi:MAG: thiamine phosphate synthase, partial [Propionibacteriaceae bacterium]